MSINCKQLRTLVIRPTLNYLGLWSESAENLLLGTAAQESQLGTYLKQINGPALGIYQIEPATHQSILNDFLNFKRELSTKVIGLADHVYMWGDKNNLLITNLAYATAICRLKYLWAPDKMPEGDDIPSLAAYWKKYYNTPLGKGTVEEFIANYKKYVTS